MIYGAVAFFTHVYVSSDGRSFVSDKSKVNSDVSLLSALPIHFHFTSADSGHQIIQSPAPQTSVSTEGQGSVG